MQIEHLELQATDLPALRDFYAGRFGLTALPAPPDRLALQVGTTLLVFAQAPEGWAGRYHFAFNIPENQYGEAKSWLAARVPLATAADGRDEFRSDDWNADILYFFDPAGNIGELIARHTLDCASDTPFGPASLRAVSEIGLATPDVPATVADLSARLGIRPYGETSDTFAPVGDENGLFIVVRAGRIWFPDTGILAEPVPLAATIRNPHGTRHRVEATTTDLTITPLAP
jgi:catechol 2,3-dioxygenase-like lactoylglutathione lyase family enzyme